ncbi:RidA family protein [Paenibacillus ihbetae]|uniref:Reactive intermediate/imine deaminase n=1 Tax=Paenibacillus ihbetae TaxID=1870820 RepID=A0ABX3JX88_9BACL|nr:RidA family protein [Paenibacillus ihbetae]OOC61380.1 reactive intermediate/imine deaminase [Paenibacillus ihbetae]
MKEPIETNRSADLPFSSAVEAGQMIFVSGQGGLISETGAIVGPDLEAQTVQTIENIREILHAAGLTLDDVVKTNVYLSDRRLYEEFNRIYRRFFHPPFPSRTAVYCELNYGLLVEIDAIAVRRSQETGGGISQCLPDSTS